LSDNTSIDNNNSVNKNISASNHDLQRQLSTTPTLQPSSICSNNSSMAAHQHRHSSQLSHSYTLHSLEPRPMKPFKSRDAYIEAMKEDLSEWLNRLYPDLALTTDNFFPQLETGAIICRHANNVTQMGRNSMLEQATTDSGGSNDNSLTHEANHQVIAVLSSPSPDCDAETNLSLRAQTNSFDHITNHRDTFSQPLSHRHRHSTTNSSISSIATNSSSASRQRLSLSGSSMISPRNNSHQIDWFRVKMIPYKSDARAGTFFARDNICQFILWCRSIYVRECLLFETDDLAARKNEKSFILCLLEVARIGFKVGMPTPLIIQLEQEIDREIENDAKLQGQMADENELDTVTSEDQTSSAIPLNHDEDCHRDVFKESSVGVEDGKKTETNDVSLQDQATLAEEEDCEQDYGPKPQVITNDLLSLHEKVSFFFSRFCVEDARLLLYEVKISCIEIFYPLYSLSAHTFVSM